MFIEERHREILRLLDEKGSISTSEIQERFGVGYDSAKRDLRILEEKGLLKRTHGGAISKNQTSASRPARDAVKELREERPGLAAIASYAVSLLRDGDNIFISAAAIGLSMIKKLPEGINLRIATNSMILAAELRAKPNIKVIFIGGELDDKGACYDGFALDILKRLRFDKCFVASTGISAGFGLSVQHSGTLPFWNAVLDASVQRIGLYPSERFGADSSVSICPVGRLSCVITDWQAKREKIAEFDELNVSVIVVDNPQTRG